MNNLPIPEKSFRSLYKPGLNRDTFFVASSTIVSAIGSLIYWKLITQRFDPVMLGLTSAAISSAVFLASMANLGLVAGLVRFIPTQSTGGKFALATFSYLTAGVAGILIFTVFFAGRQWWAPNLIPPQTGWSYPFIFALLLLSSSVTNINIAIIQTEMRTPYLVLQSVVINFIQIAGGWLVPLYWGVEGVLFTYTLPILVTAVIFYFLIFRLTDIASEKPDFRTIPYKDLMKFSLGNQVFNLIWLMPTFVFPLVVLGVLGAEASARLAIAWYGYTFVAVIPSAAMSNLMVYGSQAPDELVNRLKDALKVDLILLAPIIAFIVALAPWLLTFFGTHYVQAALLLRLLTLSCLPFSVNGLYLTLRRVRKQITSANLLALCLTATGILLSYFIIPFVGLDGIGWGWLISQTIFAVIVWIIILKKEPGIHG